MAPIDVRVPREATERLKTWVVLPADQYEQATAEIIEAALPFLRAQWEADLLSDEAADRFFDRWTLDSKLNPKRAYRESIEAALGSRFVPEELAESSTPVASSEHGIPRHSA